TQVSLGALCDTARIAVVAFARNRVEDVAENYQRGLCKERIDMDGLRIRHENHVGLVDGLPASDGRAVEHDTIGEHVFVDQTSIHGDMLKLAPGVCKAEIDEL